MSEPRRIAIVTGGTGALGCAVVHRLVRDGFGVVVPWIGEAGVEGLRSRLGDAADSVRFARVDLTDEASVEELVAGASSREGRLAALCNIAGGFTFAALADTTTDQWRRMVDMNATTAFLACRAAAPVLAEAGGGSIVNVTAMPALDRGAAMMSAYAASKAAVLNLTQSLASELAESAIRVNAIAPSIIDTPANREAMPDADTSTWLTPDEIAEVISFLVSDAATIVTGSALSLSKG